MAAFPDSATRTLCPATSMRSADLKRVTALPDNFVTVMQSVPKTERQSMCTSSTRPPDGARGMSSNPSHANK